jgi:hypothetical protein
MNPVNAVRDFISRRRNVYCKTFLNPMGQEVLEDLARFCRATETTFNPNERAHCVAEGRREVWLRIQKNLNLTDEQLWALHGAGPTSRSNTND